MYVNKSNILRAVVRYALFSFFDAFENTKLEEVTMTM